MKDYIEERAIGIANYIIDHNATVRQTAKAFGVSKSTVHAEVTKQNVQKVRLFGWLYEISDGFFVKTRKSIIFILMTIKNI